MEMPCKSPGCAGKVRVDVNDKVKGNFRFSQLESHRIMVKVSDAIPEGATVGKLEIVQPEHAEVQKQVVMFQKNAQGKVSHTDRFYLTCDAIPPAPQHTLPYEIEIEDE